MIVTQDNLCLMPTTRRRYGRDYENIVNFKMIPSYAMQVMSMSALGSLEKMPAYIPESRNLKRVYEKKRHDLLRSKSHICRTMHLASFS